MKLIIFDAFSLILLTTISSSLQDVSAIKLGDVLMPRNTRLRRETAVCQRQTQNIVGAAELLIVGDSEMARLAAEKGLEPESVVSAIHEKTLEFGKRIWYNMILKPIIIWEDDPFPKQATREEHFKMFSDHAVANLYTNNTLGDGYDLVILLTGHEWINDFSVETGHGAFGQMCSPEAVGIVEYGLGGIGRGIQQLSESIMHSMGHIMGQKHIEDVPSE